MDEVSLISTVGFPIAMCLWFMYQHQSTIEKNTASNLNMAGALMQLTDVIRKCKKEG